MNTAPVGAVTKRCPHCDHTLPRDTQHFGPVRARRDGLDCYCRPCRRAVTRAWEQAHPVELAAARRRRREAKAKLDKLKRWLTERRRLGAPLTRKQKRAYARRYARLYRDWHRARYNAGQRRWWRARAKRRERR